MPSSIDHWISKMARYQRDASAIASFLDDLRVQVARAPAQGYWTRDDVAQWLRTESNRMHAIALRVRKAHAG